MTEPTPAVYTGTLDDLELLLTVHDDGTPEIATRPVGSDPWRMWSPPIRLRRESLPVAATRTGRCTCPDPVACSDAAYRTGEVAR